MDILEKIELIICLYECIRKKLVINFIDYTRFNLNILKMLYSQISKLKSKLVFLYEAMIVVVLVWRNDKGGAASVMVFYVVVVLVTAEVVVKE